ncbi:type I glyceraldehyde-3-phosphate dehydrogenase [Dethiosulfatarculus sandiegensis]|uniref:Glyceraldehyde-3-phosphate dehydrogenase n=1 Tax=Dethiosulfatarculus sandiegensis TaxID=1429043 RepID=A0A0D2J1H0_9BACT|nr:type I glyceraldehyde-3-phosphate dehydrogenase [Dethiosulfatarculus sandiegensis]KIX12039.1 glyceraldehyde-3-phosphate dehydrogenase [Dethiosulfatarculus sandiegensis]
MGVKVGINGFGRVGRLVTRLLCGTQNGLDLAAINARADSGQLTHLLKYDSVHGVFDQDIAFTENSLTVGEKTIAITRKGSPAEIPWRELGVDLVFETTGKFKFKEDIQGHFDQGARKVLLGLPGKGAEDISLVMGVNHTLYNPALHNYISNASCTTNCLAPVAKVLNDTFNIEHGLMTTIHAVTMSQRVLDGSHKDIRRARSALTSMIPTSTGAAKAIGLIIPELSGRLHGIAIRVPTPDVSLVDLNVRVTNATTIEEVNGALKEAAQGPMKGVLKVTDEPLVSIDYTGCRYSSVVDAPLTQVMDRQMVKVIAWYDNEMGFSARLVDLGAFVAESL